MDSKYNFSKLFIIHWNARSIYSNLSEFKIYLYSKKPHLVCISESWLIPTRKPSFVDYVSLRRDRQNARGGGLLILCRHDVPHSLITLNPYNPGS